MTTSQADYYEQWKRENLLPESHDPPFVRHSESSAAAAESIAPVAGTLEAAVYRWLDANGPATDEQMQEALEMVANTQRPRRRGLVKAGRVFPIDDLGQTSSGRKATRWGTHRHVVRP